MMYSCGHLYMGRAKAGRPAGNLHTANSVPIQAVVLETCRMQWTIGRGGESGPGISVLTARRDDDDNNDDFSRTDSGMFFHSYFLTGDFFTGVWGTAKYPQLSTSFQNIQGDLYSALVWMVSILPRVSKVSVPFPSTPTTILSPSCCSAFPALWQDPSDIVLLESFFIPAWLFFHWSQSDSKSHQGLFYLSQQISAVLWSVWFSILPLISSSWNLFSGFLVNVPRAPTIIRITITFMFHSFFSSRARCGYLSSFSFHFIFTVVC